MAGRIRGLPLGSLGTVLQTPSELRNLAPYALNKSWNMNLSLTSKVSTSLPEN